MQANDLADLTVVVRGLETLSSQAAVLAEQLEAIARGLPVADSERKPENCKKRLTTAIINDVKRLFDQGRTTAEVASERGCTERYARHLREAAQYPDELIQQVHDGLVSFEEVKRINSYKSVSEVAQYIGDIAHWRKDQEGAGRTFRKEKNYVTRSVTKKFEISMPR